MGRGQLTQTVTARGGGGVCWIQVWLTKSNLGIGVVEENAGWGMPEEG